MVHPGSGRRRHPGLLGHAGHLPPGRDRRRAVHRRRRGRQRPDPAGNRRRRHAHRGAPVLAADRHAPAVQASRGRDGQCPPHRHPRPLRPGHVPPARGRRGHPLRRAGGRHPGLRRLLHHRAPDRHRSERGVGDRPSLRTGHHPLPGTSPAGPSRVRPDRGPGPAIRLRRTGPAFDPLVDPTIRKPEPTAADTAAGTAAESTGQLEGAAPSVSAASGPVTQPEPGT